jgi:hypothetical protein
MLDEPALPKLTLLASAMSRMGHLFSGKRGLRELVNIKSTPVGQCS